MDDLEKIQETNWWRVCKLLIEVGTEQLLHLFETAVQSRSTLRKFLVDNKSEIEKDRQDQKLKLENKQFTLLFCENKMKKQTDDELDKEYRKTKIDNWDITLITSLLYYFTTNGKLILTKNQCYIYKRIRYLRNHLHAHIKVKKGYKMTDSEYKEHWQEVEKVLRDLNKFTPQINIEKKIESIQKETVVDGDKLKALIETFDNWMQSKMDILDKLNQMEEKSDEQYVSLTNTVNEGVIELKQGQAELSNQLAEMKHLIPKQGAVATDRVPKKMHKGEERLPSQVSMDAEPDEDASGENVLADRFPKMTVNEPGDSRDESASSLQSNLTKQRRHNKMPPEIGFIDCLIMYAETDRDGAQKFKEHLINDIKIKEHGPVVALLYDDPKLRSLSESQVNYFEKVCELSTYKMLYMTEHFVNDKWEEFKRNACLVKSIEDDTWSVVPVYPQKKKTIKVPIAINSLKGLKYHNNDEHYRQSLANLIEAQVEVRVNENKSLIEKQKGRDRRDKEIEENHPQQDAFVQTCSQTLGASAEIQEANTIPDLEGDKMEQKEEAQIASLAEIKQKKKKKKKKKTRR